MVYKRKPVQDRDTGYWTRNISIQVTASMSGARTNLYIHSFPTKIKQLKHVFTNRN